MASAYCVVLPAEKANLEKIGERRIGETSGAASITNGFPAIFFASKESAMGTSTVGMVVVPALDGVAACESVEALACGVNKGWHGALCIGRL